MDVRRVVTGHDRDGRSVFASDESAAPVTVRAEPGTEIHRLWGADGTVRIPDDGSAPPMPAFFPPVGGFRFILLTVPPESERTPVRLDAAALAEFDEKLPGLRATMEPRGAGMHTTETVDLGVVLTGEVVLELDAGSTTLRAGDTYVQNGTRHRWRNLSAERALIAVFSVGARHGGTGNAP